MFDLSWTVTDIRPLHIIFYMIILQFCSMVNLNMVFCMRLFRFHVAFSFCNVPFHFQKSVKFFPGMVCFIPHWRRTKRRVLLIVYNLTNMHNLWDPASDTIYFYPLYFWFLFVGWFLNLSPELSPVEFSTNYVKTLRTGEMYLSARVPFKFTVFISNKRHLF